MKARLQSLILPSVVALGVCLVVIPLVVQNKIASWEKENAPDERLFNLGGLHFQIPPHIINTSQGDTSYGYLRYLYYTEGNVMADTSSVSIFVPLSKSPSPVEDPIEIIPKDAVWKMNNWGVLQGDRYIYDINNSDPLASWKGTITKEIYPVTNSDLPIVLSYKHSLHDDTLDEFWNTLHNNIRMSLHNNLSSYQAYRIKLCNSLICDPSPLQQ